MSGAFDMRVRDAGRADLPAILAIYNSGIASRIATGDIVAVTLDSRLDWFDGHDPDHYPLWVAEADGTICGWLGFQPLHAGHAFARTAALSLYVSPQHRRMGVGRMLMRKAIEDSPRLGLDSLVGFVFAHNAPILQLVTELGFERWGRLPRIAEIDAAKRDVIVVGIHPARAAA